MSSRIARTAVVLAAAVAVLGAAPAPAGAAVPCWKKLINDWYDGTINNVYPIPCYRQAIDHLPTDVQVYSSARDDILNALRQAIADQKRKKEAATATTTEAPPRTTRSAPTTTARTTTAPPPVSGTGHHGGGGGSATGGGGPPENPPKPHNGPVNTALRDITPGGADSFPLPLLVLGGLAILLVLAGVAGVAWRRLQGRGGMP